MTDTITYHNLSQCIGNRMVYFRSTDIEQRNYHRLLWEVPSEWFYWLYLGKHIHVVDVSSNGRGKVERVFVPVLNDVIGIVVGQQYPRASNLEFHFNTALIALNQDKQLKRRYMFWKGKISPFFRDITASTIHVEKEPNPLCVRRHSGERF